MRLSRAVVAEREAFLTEFFKTNKDATAKAANEALKAKFKTEMRLQRVYQIKKAATAEVEAPKGE